MKNIDFIKDLVKIVGLDNVYTKEEKKEFYRKGWRSGEGDALAVVFPGDLYQQWQVLELCVLYQKIIIMQAANTGLTEGSTPSGSDYDRDVVVINTKKLKKIISIQDGKQVISLPGSTLHSLEKILKPLKRAPHSVIGSSCLGASIVGGIANNSGGALVKRGPAYTEYSVYAQINKDGELILKNNLGIYLGDSPKEILTRLQEGNFSDEDIIDNEKMASDRDYINQIRDVESPVPARFNADKRRLYESSGCAGKLGVFAVRLDTFPIQSKEKTFYLGTNDPKEFNFLRRDILKNFKNLPEVAEYMHRDVFNLSEKYGKDTLLLIHHMGTDHMPKLFSIKGRVDSFLNKIPFLPNFLSDRIMQAASIIFPQTLPKRMLKFRDDFEHHLILKMSDDGIEEAEHYLNDKFSSKDNSQNGFFECTVDEAKKAYLHRFAAAGVAVRYQIIHSKDVEGVVALDIALRRNEKEWMEVLPAEIDEAISHKLYYGHFMCQVFHQDYFIKKGYDVKVIKEKMLKILDDRGAKYPAEHNVGHLYQADDDLKKFYASLDPTNSFNPGIGKMPKKRSCC